MSEQQQTIDSQTDVQQHEQEHQDQQEQSEQKQEEQQHVNNDNTTTTDTTSTPTTTTKDNDNVKDKNPSIVIESSSPPAPTKNTTESTTSTTSTPSTETTTQTKTQRSPIIESANISFQERLHYYKEALKPTTLDLTVIQHLAEQGIPEANGLRSIYWKILLHYLPIEQSRWASFTESSRATYQEWINELMVNPYKEIEQRKNDHPLSTSDDSKWNEYFKDQNILVDIEKDVRRTFPMLHFFNHEEGGKSIHYEALRRILFIYAKLNPGIRYVQGMNELLGPIYYTFATDPLPDCKANAEADAFYCFTNLMSEVRDNFCKTLDKSESGVIGNIKKLNLLLNKKDRQLWKDMEEKKLHPQFYSFRWITLLLSQEFELPDVLRLWDSLFSDPNRFDFLYYFCCAMLICVRQQLLDSPFADNLKMLQHYPNNIDFHTIYSTALSLKDGTFQLNTEDVFQSGQSYFQMFNPFSKATSPPSPLAWSPANNNSPHISPANSGNSIPTMAHIHQASSLSSNASSSNSSTTSSTSNSSSSTSTQQQHQTNNSPSLVSSLSPPIADSFKSFFNKLGSLSIHGNNNKQ
ncbi:hypothetical protein SAMD00019534_057120 [Acytostelium subglobosum LB1]|uniref:hypothetical protein n=1 Tax=Acytostelium subglobosum LB1 TaxID=1410327 RepID=UPI000644C2A4|nr:hypothetical protein SAMD00019534_057120 [Acytostelium subglobosum LB1]GAM22537.1 hypothetical protein SAMD00019534_057120 [Acytostelium subglobosum LB1]|eukprot:XP_012754657.1 hypothetical protein SAMD00019534_057120 [Acytostelium subglobosum LB1]